MQNKENMMNKVHTNKFYIILSIAQEKSLQIGGFNDTIYVNLSHQVDCANQLAASLKKKNI